MDRYDLYKQAERTGKCSLCGWKDGDGVKMCYYDSDIGAVTHQNSMEAAKSQMTQSQRSLVESYESAVYSVMHNDLCNVVKAYLKRIAKVENETLLGKSWKIGGCLYPMGKYKTREEAAEAWIGSKRCLENYLSQGCKIIRSRREDKEDTIFEDFEFDIITYDVQKPHCCGGFAKYADPYHIKCSGCDEEVKLWEFGIHYDIG